MNYAIKKWKSRIVLCCISNKEIYYTGDNDT